MASSGLIAILFTDLVGSTELGASIGDEAADELRRQHFATLRAAISNTGGTEVKTIGDALMVTYPGAADAIEGAVAMQRGVDSDNAESAHDISMRIGISVGDATFEDGDWFGTPVIEASRLTDLAEGRQILISDLVRMLAGSRTEHKIEGIGPLELKGLPDPMDVSQVSWVRVDGEPRGQVPLPAQAAVVNAFPFAGRAHELSDLVDGYKAAAAGARKVLLLGGEPGIGKSRLIAEVASETHDSGALVLWGRCDEALDVAHQPFVEALRHYTSNVGDETLAQHLGALGGELGRLLPELHQRIPGLAPPTTSDSDTERHLLFEAVVETLVAITADTPTLLVLEDLHWADTPSLLLLRHLAHNTNAERLMVVAAYRNTDLDREHPLASALAELRRLPDVDRMDLVGLDRDEVTLFLERAAGHRLDAPGRMLAVTAHRETDGNPFFLGEILRHLAETGGIVQQDGRWTADLDLARAGIPAGIREVVGRRFDRLDDAARTALSVASVVGRSFDIGLVADASGQPRMELFDALDSAASANLVQEIPDQPGRYSFSHALMQSTLYEELPANRRLRLHWAVGEALERRNPDDLDSLSRHFGEGALAGDPVKAAHVCLEAGSRSFVELSFEGAVVHYRRGLAALEIDSQADSELGLRISVQLCRALYAAADPAARELAFATIERALERGHPGLAADALIAVTRSENDQIGVVDDVMVATIKRTLDANQKRDLRRAKLLNRLIGQLLFGPHVEERAALQEEIKGIADETGDAAVHLCLAESARAAIDGRRRFIDMLASRAEFLEQAGRDDPLVAFDAAQMALDVAYFRGERDAVGRAVEAMRDAAERLRRPALQATARFSHLSLRFANDDLEGLWDDIDDLVVWATERSVAAEAIMSNSGVLYQSLRRAQGHTAEFLPVLRNLVETQPGLVTWRLALAVALDESDQSAAAMEQIEPVIADDFAMLEPDALYPVAMNQLGRLALRCPISAPVCQRVYDNLLPFEGTFCHTFRALLDHQDHALAILAARLGDPERSDALFQSAVDHCRSFGTSVLEALARSNWAHVLSERGDVDGAREQCGLAISVAGFIGVDSEFSAQGRAKRLLVGLG